MSAVKITLRHVAFLSDVSSVPCKRISLLRMLHQRPRRVVIGHAIHLLHWKLTATWTEQTRGATWNVRGQIGAPVYLALSTVPGGAKKN